MTLIEAIQKSKEILNSIGYKENEYKVLDCQQITKEHIEIFEKSGQPGFKEGWLIGVVCTFKEEIFKFNIFLDPNFIPYIIQSIQKIRRKK